MVCPCCVQWPPAVCNKCAATQCSLGCIPQYIVLALDLEWPDAFNGQTRPCFSRNGSTAPYPGLAVSGILTLSYFAAQSFVFPCGRYFFTTGTPYAVPAGMTVSQPLRDFQVSLFPGGPDLVFSMLCNSCIKCGPSAAAPEVIAQTGGNCDSFDLLSGQWATGSTNLSTQNLIPPSVDQSGLYCWRDGVSDTGYADRGGNIVTNGTVEIIDAYS